MSEFPSLLRPNNIPLYGHATFCLPVISRWTLQLFPPLQISPPVETQLRRYLLCKPKLHTVAERVRGWTVVWGLAWWRQPLPHTSIPRCLEQEGEQSLLAAYACAAWRRCAPDTGSHLLAMTEDIRLIGWPFLPRRRCLSSPGQITVLVGSSWRMGQGLLPRGGPQLSPQTLRDLGCLSLSPDCCWGSRWEVCKTALFFSGSP